MEEISRFKWQDSSATIVNLDAKIIDCELFFEELRRSCFIAKIGYRLTVRQRLCLDRK